MYIYDTYKITKWLTTLFLFWKIFLTIYFKNISKLLIHTNLSCTDFASIMLKKSIDAYLIYIKFFFEDKIKRKHQCKNYLY